MKVIQHEKKHMFIYHRWKINNKSIYKPNHIIDITQKTYSSEIYLQIKNNRKKKSIYRDQKSLSDTLKH